MPVRRCCGGAEWAAAQRRAHTPSFTAPSLTPATPRLDAPPPKPSHASPLCLAQCHPDKSQSALGEAERALSEAAFKELQAALTAAEGRREQRQKRMAVSSAGRLAGGMLLGLVSGAGGSRGWVLSPAVPPLSHRVSLPAASLAPPPKHTKAEDFDEEELEALEAENEAEEELFDQVGGWGGGHGCCCAGVPTLCKGWRRRPAHLPPPPPPRPLGLQVSNGIGAFLRKYGDAALPYVELLMPKVAPLLDKARR